jgi:CheY-like chemotaxis protein
MIVLVAHTDRWTRLLVRDVVTDAGSTVVEASNGSAALRLAIRTQPDLVLLGPSLSEIDARDVVCALRAETGTRWVPVVMLRDAQHAGVPAVRWRCVRRARRQASGRVRRRQIRHHAQASARLVRVS